MPILNRVAEFVPDIVSWRHDLHAHPELLFDVHRTAATVADRLHAFGCDEVVTGIGRTGVVGVIRGARGRSDRVIGLRADMDALPITEATGVAYASTAPGLMHACGHDGHTSMLLGAAKYLAETRNFDGTAVVIFQPAEEGGAGGDAMVKDGLFERFGIQEVYGLHNWPGLPVGHFAIRHGAMMAAADRFEITIEGRGGHAAYPHQCVDTVLCAAHMVTALQSVVSRTVDPLQAAVVSIGSLKTGETYNVIPQVATLLGTVRTLDEGVRDLCQVRIKALVEATAAAFGAQASVDYRPGYPVTMNHAGPADFMAEAARQVAGPGAVNMAIPPQMGAEDFSYMLARRPGAYMFVGNGDTAMVHNPAYDFNDEAIPYGVSLWARLVETGMPAT